MTREAKIPLPPEDVIESLRTTYRMIKKTERDARIADQLKELKRLENALSATDVALQKLSPATWDTIDWMARRSTSGYHLLTLLGIPDSDSPPKPDEIKRINEWVKLMLSHVIHVRGSFEDRGGVMGQPALRQLVKDLMPIWQNMTGKKPTFSHAGSAFEDFACQIVAEIDDQFSYGMHEIVRYVLTKK